MTNWEKVVGWDADFYKSLPDEDCIVCLTEKQVYLLAQTLDQLTWERTRWTGDKSSLDFDAIASEVQYALRERMTCEKLTDLIEQVQLLTDIIVNNQASVPTINYETTVMEDIFPLSEQEATTLAQTETCDTPARDAVFGACRSLVQYLTQANQDFLERVSQAGNVPDRISEIIAATPLGILPLDEAVGWLTFIAEELLDEYNATVDTELLDAFTCDLFCLATDNDCHLTSDILLSYLQSKVPATIGNVADTLFDLVQFALTGTFSGNDYFWYMTYFQVWVRFAGQVWFGQRGISGIAIAAQTGLNSPDNDWTLLCTDCPAPYPSIISGWCLTGDVWGNVAQEGVNTWLVSFTADGGGGSSANIRDVENAIFKVLTIERIVSGFEAAQRTESPCVQIFPIFGWNNTIGQINTNGYLWGTDVLAGQIRITVGRIGQ